METVCMVCGEHLWGEKEYNPLSISHGLCKTCREGYKKDIAKWKEEHDNGWKKTLFS